MTSEQSCIEHCMNLPVLNSFSRAASSVQAGRRDLELQGERGQHRVEFFSLRERNVREPPIAPPGGGGNGPNGDRVRHLPVVLRRAARVSLHHQRADEVRILDKKSGSERSRITANRRAAPSGPP